MGGRGGCRQCAWRSTHGALILHAQGGMLAADGLVPQNGDVRVCRRQAVPQVPASPQRSSLYLSCPPSAASRRPASSRVLRRACVIERAEV